MKKIHLLLVLFVSIFLMQCGKKGDKVVELPDYGLQNSQTLEVSKVVLTDTSTILYIDAYFPHNQWIRIDSATYIQANGEKYTIQDAEGIVINEHHFMPESNEDHFSLIFPSIPKDTKKIDFIESDCDDCFKIWDINLTGKIEKYNPDLPSEILTFQPDKNASLPEPEFKMGKTKVTLHLSGLKEGYALNNLRMIVNNIFTLEQDEAEPQKIKDGEYLFEVNQYATTSAFIMFGNVYMNILLDPGESADIYYDLTAYSKLISRHHPQPDMVYAGFKGKFAQINTQLLRQGDSRKDYQIDFYENPEILEMSAEEYIDNLYKVYDEKTTFLGSSDLSEGMKQIIKADLKTSLVNNVLGMQQVFEYNYRNKHNLQWNDPMDYKAPEITDKELASLKKIELNDPMWIYSRNYGFIASSLTQKVPSETFLNDITNSEKGLLQDMRKTSDILTKASSLENLSKEEEATLNSTSSPYYAQLYTYIFEKSKKQQEEALAKGGFEIKETPKVSNDKIIEAIVAQYKGKALFIDFWATWCGPCLNAMKVIKPLKAEMAEKGVITVYISNSSSPKARWSSMLPDIGGIHYYLTEDQWRVVGDKYKIQGIPTYMIFDKTGKKTFETAGYPGNDKMKEELTKVW